MIRESERDEERPESEGTRLERRRVPAPPQAERRDLLADRYELLELLGRGGSASVWHAYDKRLAREVALKIFHLGTQDREALARALREAKAASHIASDHVVRIRDVAWGGAKGAYIDMELCADFVDGELIVGRSIAQTPPRDLSEAARWVMQAAHGVQSAHDLSVFHRDLKPDNILIRPASRIALVTDFGLARQPLWREEDADTPLPGAELGTTWQEVQHYVGTPAYMAPEQAEGLFRHLARLPRDPDARPLDPTDEDRLARIDVYGLGAVLYECLAGRPPYQPREPSSDRTQEALDVLAQIRVAAPPSLRGLTRVQRGRADAQRFRVPRRLHRIVQKAMARDPAARYASAAELARDLASFLERQPTSFERRRYHARALLWGVRNLRPLLASSLAVVGFVSLSLARPEEGPPRALSLATDPKMRVEAPMGPPHVLVAQVPDANARTAAVNRAARGDARGREPRTRRGATGTKGRPTTAASPEALGAPPDPRAAPSVRASRVDAPDTSLSIGVPAANVAGTNASMLGRPDSTASSSEPVGGPSAGSAVRASAGVATLDSDARAPQPTPPPPAAVATFIDAARRSGAPLIQIIDATGTVTEYCLNPAGSRDARSCVTQAQCSEDERAKLEKLHRQSARAFIWHLDAQHRVIRKCEKTRPYDNNIIRKTCDPVSAG